MSTTINSAFCAAWGVIFLFLLGGCGGVSELTKERVARAETSVQQTQQTIGRSEGGAVELQRARDTLAAGAAGT